MFFREPSLACYREAGGDDDRFKTIFYSLKYPLFLSEPQTSIATESRFTNETVKLFLEYAQLLM